ncbi:hypothetical protein BGZ49_009896 [Haplosporangium sp. Z 27]|nr:hypothetical protein BGZ49_009896 [Haplosporangium sp. Z 27]
MDCKRAYSGFSKPGAGNRLPVAGVRAAMILRINSQLHGSIGASDDIVPLTYIAGSIIGHNAGLRVEYQGRNMGATEALQKFELLRLHLQPKEAFTMLNRTVSATCLHDILAESGLVRTADSRNRNPEESMGPIVDSTVEVVAQIEVDMSSTTDNPLIDPETSNIVHGGNLLAQYTAVATDRLRYSLGPVTKHLDVQMAQLVALECNNGLAPSLVGNSERHIGVGLQGIQISANSFGSLISFFGNSLADRFPTHADQFNQNINSQAFG